MGDPARNLEEPQPDAEKCARCERSIGAGDRVAAADKVFCRSCYETLRQEVVQAVQAATTDVNYPMGALGALLGGAIGAGVWWGITVATSIGFGLIAIVIGFLAGLGALRFTGGKRSGGLQAVAMLASGFSYLVASFLVNTTFINRALETQQDPRRLGFVPRSFEHFFQVTTANFNFMDVVFLAICLYQAWAMVKPPRLPAEAAAK